MDSEHQCAATLGSAAESHLDIAIQVCMYVLISADIESLPRILEELLVVK